MKIKKNQTIVFLVSFVLGMDVCQELVKSENTRGTTVTRTPILLMIKKMPY